MKIEIFSLFAIRQIFALGSGLARKVFSLPNSESLSLSGFTRRSIMSNMWRITRRQTCNTSRDSQSLHRKIILFSSLDTRNWSRKAVHGVWLLRSQKTTENFTFLHKHKRFWISFRPKRTFFCFKPPKKVFLSCTFPPRFRSTQRNEWNWKQKCLNSEARRRNLKPLADEAKREFSSHFICFTLSAVRSLFSATESIAVWGKPVSVRAFTLLIKKKSFVSWAFESIKLSDDLHEKFISWLASLTFGQAPRAYTKLENIQKPAGQHVVHRGKFVMLGATNHPSSWWKKFFLALHSQLCYRLGIFCKQSARNEKKIDEFSSFIR